MDIFEFYKDEYIKRHGNSQYFDKIVFLHGHSQANMFQELIRDFLDHNGGIRRFKLTDLISKG